MKNKNANAKCTLQIRDEDGHVEKVSVTGEDVEDVVSGVFRQYSDYRKCSIVAEIAIRVLESQDASPNNSFNEARTAFIDAGLVLLGFWMDLDKLPDDPTKAEPPAAS